MAHKFQSLVKLNFLVCCLTLNCHSFHTSLPLKSRCTKSLDLIKVLSNTIWGADRKVLLRLYRALIRSNLDYGCIVYGSVRPSYIKRLDTVHNQGLRLCLGAFPTSPVHILYVEANEPPLDMRRTCLSLQYCV